MSTTVSYFEGSELLINELSIHYAPLMGVNLKTGPIPSTFGLIMENW